MMNLLTEPLLRVQTNHGLRRLSLPGLLAALGRDEVEHFVGMQRHQEDGFYVFLCYLGAAVLARRGQTETLQTEGFWREGLAELAGPHADDAWSLVVADLSRPAFMQPPLPSEDHTRLQLKAETADQLDVLVTAKNHDLKQTRARFPELDQWVYALVSLQTMSGYLGQGNYGISRMNSGHGNRPIVELVRTFRFGGRWRDAVARMLAYRQELLAGAWGYDPHGLVLVWTEPWDGQQKLPLSRLDPFYVEICRRIRLRGTPPFLRADGLSSTGPRLAAEELAGVVGDPWLPLVHTEKGKGKGPGVKALTVGPDGLTASRLRDLIFEDGLQLTVLQKPDQSWEGDTWLSASVLVRGQGKTEGFHQRVVPVPAKVKPWLFSPAPQRDRFRQLSKTAVEMAETVEQRVLKPAVFAYLEGGPEQIKFDRDSAEAWWRRFATRFNELWSDRYFTWLWSVPDPFDEQTELQRWAEELRQHALVVLQEAEKTLPEHCGRRWRARTAARRVFFGALKTKVPILYKDGGQP